MLISAMQHSPSPAAHFSLVFHYFDGNSPLLSFLRFHEEFVLRSDYEESKKYLHEFQLNMDKVCTTIIYSVYTVRYYNIIVKFMLASYSWHNYMDTVISKSHDQHHGLQ